jgi:adenine-specific DNA-methyltransferase
MTQLDGKSMDIVSENVTKLKELFPEVFSEAGKIDFKKLEEEMGQFTDADVERYNFTWAGKTEAKQIAQTPSTGTLRPCVAESKNWDTTQNLYIEGDNLEVLKLLQKSYHKQVKMIYIDPPYNTGKDFVYKDNFHDNIRNYLELTGQVDSEGNKLSTNSDTNGRYHSDWLNMIYPRLKLARNLLKDDGVIFISIDDNEVANLRKVCDEIFGEDNFVANICHKSRASVSNDKIISSNHNHLLFYTKNYELLFSNRKYFGLNPDLEGFKKDDEDGKGKYKYTPVDGPGGALKGNPYYTFLDVTGYFRYSKDEMQRKYDNGEVVKVGNGLQRKYYLEDAKKSRKTDTTWWEDKLYTSSATTNLKTLMNGDYFTNPKHINLVKRILEQATIANDLILDFFSGSATTAHTVMELNRDGGNRKYICVQLPEETDEKSEAYKAGYKNICEIGKERIRRAGEKIIADNPDKNLSGLDIGFKVLKLDSSNIKTWNSDFENLEANLLDAVDNVKSDRTVEDLLYEVLLKYGLNLTLPIEEKSINGSKIFVIGFGALIVCLDDHVTLDTVKYIAKLKEEYAAEKTRVVFKDSSFSDAVVKTNALQTLKQFGIDEVVSI